MKKIISAILILTMSLALTACAKEQTVTYSAETNEDGLVMTDTIVLSAKGDRVQTMTEDIKVDMSVFDEEIQTLLTEMYDQMLEAYQAVDGVVSSGGVEDSVYTIHLEIDATGDAISELAEQNLLEVTGDSSGISLQQTGEALEENGYRLVE